MLGPCLALLKININQQVHKIPQMTCGTFCGFSLPRISVNFMTRTFIGAFSACPGLLLRISGASRDTEVFGSPCFRPLFGKLRGVYQHTQAQYKDFKISKQKVWKYKMYDNSEKETYCSLTQKLIKIGFHAVLLIWSFQPLVWWHKPHKKDRAPFVKAKKTSTIGAADVCTNNKTKQQHPTATPNKISKKNKQQRTTKNKQ